MEQSLHQLQSDLQINDSHGRLSGGYLAYIKSKHSINKKEEGDINSIREEWNLNYECSQFEIPLNADNHSRTLNFNHSKKHTSLPVSLSESESVSERKDDAEDAIEVVTAPNTHSNLMFDSPNLILFDNFVMDNSSDCSVDFGQYVPSGVKQDTLKKQFNGNNEEKYFIKKVRKCCCVQTHQNNV